MAVWEKSTYQQKVPGIWQCIVYFQLELLWLLIISKYTMLYQSWVFFVFWYTPSGSSFAACWDRNANTLTSNEELMFDEGEERATISVLHHCSGCKVIMSSGYQENRWMWLISESYVQLVICSVEVWCCKKKSEIISGNWGASCERGWLILLRSSQSTVQGQWIAIRALAAGAPSTKSIAQVES